MPGADAPAASCVMKTNTRVSHREVTGIAPHSRTQWFYGLLRALPGDEFVFATVVRGLRFGRPGWADFASANLTPATGARTTRLHRTQKRRSSCAPHFAHEVHLALRLLFARLTPSRPPHPIPNVRDDRDTPLQGERDGLDMHLIWVRREAKYF
jgi:hypothetical protein